MSGFLSRLVARSMASSPVVRPRSGCLFEPQKGRSGEAPDSGFMDQAAAQNITRPTSAQGSNGGPPANAPGGVAGTEVQGPAAPASGGRADGNSDATLARNPNHISPRADPAPTSRREVRPGARDELINGAKSLADHSDDFAIRSGSARSDSMITGANADALRDGGRAPASVRATVPIFGQDAFPAPPGRWGALLAPTQRILPQPLRFASREPARDSDRADVTGRERGVQVTIGRVEVRAVIESGPRRSQPARPPAAPLSLEDYLSKRG